MRRSGWLKRVIGAVIAVTVLAGGISLAGAPVSAAAASNPFSDVNNDVNSPVCSAFAREIQWMDEQRISTGWGTGAGRQYRPYEAVSREAMAAFLYRAAGSPAFTAPAVSKFRDVPTSNPFFREISWLDSTGVSTGWAVGGAREFRPSLPITRDAMAAFLYRFAKITSFAAPAASPFIDVPTSNGFYKEITWLAKSGVSTGWAVGGGKEFRPYSNITRDAMAAFLFRHKNPGVVVSPVACDPVAAWKITASGIGPVTLGLRGAALKNALGSGWTRLMPTCPAAEVYQQQKGWFIASGTYKSIVLRADAGPNNPNRVALSNGPVGPATPAGVRLGMTQAQVDALPGVKKHEFWNDITWLRVETTGSIRIEHRLHQGRVVEIAVNYKTYLDGNDPLYCST